MTDALGNGQCYDTHLGVTYPCSGGGNAPQNPGGGNAPQNPSGGERKGPFVCLGGQSCNGVPNPSSKQNPWVPPKTIGEFFRNVGDAISKFWIPAVVESSKGYVKAEDETVAPEAKCVSDFVPLSRAAKSLHSIDRAQRIIEVTGTEGWINKLKAALPEVLPGTSCLELVHVQYWKKRGTQFEAFYKCLKVHGPFTCLWIVADKSRPK
jgi:hypothetical protein